MSLIRQAIADGMTPVVSYKVPNPTTMANGGYDAWLVTLRNQLDALDTPVTATYWHEPHGDMTPAEFRAGSLKFVNLVDSPDIAVGPILNGWLLDRRVDDFASYTDSTLLNKWEFVGVDSYQEGTASDPSTTLLPARAVPKTAAWLDTQGFPDKKILLGEYNGFTGSAIEQAGEYILSTPELWIGNVWNVDHTTFSVLTATDSPRSELPRSTLAHSADPPDRRGRLRPLGLAASSVVPFQSRRRDPSRPVVTTARDTSRHGPRSSAG